MALGGFVEKATGLARKVSCPPVHVAPDGSFIRPSGLRWKIAGLGWWRWRAASMSILVYFLLLTFPSSGRCDSLTVSGFMDKVSGVTILPHSQPAHVKPLNKSPIPPDVDLVLMSKWGLNYLAGTITVVRDYESSYGNWPLHDPPFSMAGDSIAGGDTERRNDVAFVLMRQMSGAATGRTVQAGLRKRLLKHYHASGLFIPTSGDTDVIWATTWLALGLIETHATTGDQASLNQARHSLETLRRFAMKSDEQGRLWLDPPATIEWEGRPLKITYRAGLDFCVMEPYVRFYEVTAEARMLQIARVLADGRLDGLSRGHDGAHMHSMMHGVVPMAHLGALTGERRYLDWAEARLRETDPFRTDYGWVAAVRDAHFSNPKISETCALADVMHVAIYLARAGRSGHWDFVERALRNYLPQEQFFVDETFQGLWNRKHAGHSEALRKGLSLLRRMEGGFFCRTDPEDRWSDGTLSLEGCCPPTGMTALYSGWSHIVTKNAGGMFVNMALNYESPDCRVVSFLPDQGRVTVAARKPGSWHLRIPGFAPREQVCAWRNSRKEARPVWNGDYIQFDSVKAGDELTVTYPLVTFVQKMRRGGVDYTISWKGNSVTDISPKGKVWPLFRKVPFPTPPMAADSPGKP